MHLFSNKTRSSECLGWSRSRTGRFVDSIDKRLVTGTGYALRSTELEELCSVSKYTIWTQFSCPRPLHIEWKETASVQNQSSGLVVVDLEHQA